MTKAPSDVDEILPITQEELLAWHAKGTKQQIVENFERIDKHIISFDELVKKPRAAGTASQFTVIFMHVPKTGGTTLEYLLAKNYTINGVLHINAPALQDNPYALFKKKDLPHVVMGHHKMCHLLYRFVDRPLVHFIMLRDPVRRVLSYFDYLQTSPNHKLHEKASARILDDFIDAEDMVELSNAQTLRIAGMLRKNKVWRTKIDMNEAYEIAQQCIAERFSLVGLTERYAEFLIMAKKTLGWNDIYYERRNVSKKKTKPEDVPSDVMERIHERNEYDIKLYEFTQKLFDERCQQLGIDEAALAKFNDYNRRYQDIVGATDL